MTELTQCGCLHPSAKKMIADVLNTYLEVVEDPDLKTSITSIKEKIESCKCEIPNSKEPEKTKEEKTKRAPSERNIFMGKCMRGKEKGGDGKGMAECSVDWKGVKNP